jgi:voltage-gated potassium channel
MMPKTETPLAPNDRWPAWRRRLHDVIFEADTTAGLVFDAALLVTIISSVLVIMLGSVVAIREAHGELLDILEWAFTGLFTLEYALRLLTVKRPLRYATSFFGVVDLLSILPTWLSLLMTGTSSLMVVRTLRLLRAFRVFKMAAYLVESRILLLALARSRRKIAVFLTAVLSVVVVAGALMYVVEGPENGFTSIPAAMYWAIVTITTVGYGDISPHTPFGQAIAALMMVLGYGVLAVPTGIVSVELAEATRHPEASAVSTRHCASCAAEGHEADARFCRRCGAPLDG